MSSDTGLLEADQAARNAAIDAGRSLIVQAPAGSGKTELLIQRYLALLSTVDNPEEVLAITFTIKAASEMRLRIVQALQRAAQGDKPALTHEEITFKAALRVLDRDQALDWRLLQSPRRMRIQTLDAFSAGIARSLPVTSGLGQVGQTVVDEEMKALHRAAAAATFDSLDASDERSIDVERVLGHLDNNTSVYVGYLARMLAARDQWLSIVGGETPDATQLDLARARIERAIEQIVVRQLQQIRERIATDRALELVDLVAFAAQNLSEGENPDHALANLHGIAEMPGSDSSSLAAWHAIASLLLTKEGTWRKIVNKRDGFPASEKARKKDLYQLIDDLQDADGLRELLHRVRILPLPHYSDEQWSVLLALFEVLRIAVAELRRLFDERGVSDHTEVAIAAGTALGTAERPGDMALMLDYSIRHLLIDEMQDTSVGQYQLIEQLTAGWQEGDGRTLFCVGDPMQSIYRFRDAEVGRFVQAQISGVGGVALQPLTLRQNFRSGENLVHWFNTVFSQIMPFEDDTAAGAIAYSESVPAATGRGEGECSIHPLIDATPEMEAESVLRSISECCERFPQESKALLVRSRTHLTALLPMLRNAGIQYQAIELDRLTDLPEIIDVLALTRSLCHDADRLAWLALLRGPWVGLSWQDLHMLVSGDTRATLLELASNEARVARLSDDGRRRLNNFVSVMDAHRQPSATISLRDRVEIAWFDLGGPALLRDKEQTENVYRFFDLLARVESSGTLVDVLELERLLDAERVSGTAEAGSPLQIMTMHKAKGLEFDHVFLIGLGRIPRRGQKSVLNWLSVPDERNENTMIVSPVGARAELENDPLHQYIEAVEKDKNRYELERLLYVACTRARKSLYLSASVRRSADGTSLRSPDPDSLLHRIWPVISADFERALADDVAAATATDGNAELVEPVLKRLRQKWATPDAPSLPASRPVDDGDDADREVDYYWVGSAARHAGTIIHRWLQRMTRPRSLLSATQIKQLRPINETWARQLGVPADQIDEVCERVAMALQNTLEDEKGRWLLGGDGHAEMAATGLQDGSLYSVVIDRVRIDAEGTHWIVDYKSSTHEGGDLGGFLQQESDRYRSQLARYKEIYSGLVEAPVRTALYFPLLQEFCEVEINR